MVERQTLHILVEALPDDEPMTAEDLAAIREGFADKARGDVVSQEEAERLLLGSKLAPPSGAA
jgi:predicted transcriptional regulator